jgi:hypothetical protein
VRAIEPLVITTSSKGRERGDAVAQAQALAHRLGVTFIPCEKGTPADALLEGAHAVLVLRGDGVVLLDAGGSARWTAGMADRRIRQRVESSGHAEPLLEAADIRQGDAVLDATLGRGHDALVLEHAVGPAGKIVGIEKSLPLYGWTSEGLARRKSRIACVHGDALDVLRAMAAQSFDVVFFDPMFTRAAHSEATFARVRRHAEMAPLSLETLAEARRVARRFVVVKQPPQSSDFRRLGLELFPFNRGADLRFARAAPLH